MLRFRLSAIVWMTFRKCNHLGDHADKFEIEISKLSDQLSSTLSSSSPPFTQMSETVERQQWALNKNDVAHKFIPSVALQMNHEMPASQFSFFNVDLIDVDIRPAALGARLPLHRKGFRNLAARTLRRLRCRAPPCGVARGKSRAQPHQSPCTTQTIDIYFANVLSINSAVRRAAL